MSDVHQQNTSAVADTPVSEPITTSQQPQTSTIEEPTKAVDTADTPIAAAMAKPENETTSDTPITDSIVNSPEHKDAIAATEDKKDVTEKKPVEPITEGQLAVKGPGLLKSILPSKKEFWLSDEAVSPQDLSSYMRGEKPEIAHPVVAWASHTGKGLLFFNKKGDTARKQPGHVLALYDASDLKKESPHEISFRLNGQEHVLKATSDNERDGWYMSLEKAIELGKSQKEEVRESEAYKSEMEKLNKPAHSVTPAVAAAKRSQSQPKKSTEVEKTDAAGAAGAQRKNSDFEDEANKDKKSRSASRGVLDRLTGKKDETETKKQVKEENKVEHETKPEEHYTEAAPIAAGVVGGTAAGAAIAGTSSTEDKKEETIESPTTTTTEEKSKPAKRGSIFGKMQGWGGIKSPSKEKEQKDAELKPEVPPKDNTVAETAPQLPETTATEPAEVVTTNGDVKPETTATETSTAANTKPGFLSSLSFSNKRNRSVSPSANMKEAPATTEQTAPIVAPVEAPKEAEPVEEVKSDKLIGGTNTVDPLSPLKPEGAVAKTDEPTKTEQQTSAEKDTRRQSVFSNLGRRASKAFKGMNSPRKENTAPTTAVTKPEETTEAVKSTEEPTTTEESKTLEPEQQHQIGDVVPEAITLGEPNKNGPTGPSPVAASA